MKTNHIVFVEDRNQVFWIKETNFYNPNMTLIALTADALQSLEELHYPCYPISDITELYPLVQEEEKYTKDIFELSKEIERYIGQRYLSAQFDGPGFLSGNYYCLQDVLTAIAKRAFLMREAIRFFSPAIVTAFQRGVNEWFVGFGYEKNPWFAILEIFSKEYHFKISFVQIKTKKSALNHEDFKEGDKIWGFLYQKYCTFFKEKIKPYIRIKRILNKITNYILNLNKTETLPEKYNGLRVLFTNSTGYDWEPVLELFETNKNIKSYKIDPLTLTKAKWGTTTFNSSVKEVFSRNEYKLNVESPTFKEQESKDLEQLFTQWLKERQDPPKIIVLGMDLFPYLIPPIKTMIIQGLEIIRYTDTISLSALKKVQPHVACFFNITYLPERRFAYQCEKLGIPVVVYHHGFGYNVKIQPADDGTDQACADYILSHGVGTNPRSNPIFPVKAKFIHVGSARIEKMMQTKHLFHKNRDNKCKILWIANSTTHNTWNATLSEDTKRYKIQKKCLNILSKSEKNSVIYRSLLYQVFNDGTSTWIKNENIPSISMDPYTPLEDLIINSDVIILDISSLTTWAEVIGLNKPMILYYDLRQSPLEQDFIPDLEQACHWCKTEDELIIAINRLVFDMEKFFSELNSFNTTEFKNKYFLHKGYCAQRVCSFLNEVCRNKKDICKWESEINNGMLSR